MSGPLPAPTHDDGERIACPWCGHKHGDLAEYFRMGSNTARAECEECRRPFRLTAEHMRHGWRFTAEASR